MFNKTKQAMRAVMAAGLMLVASILPTFAQDAADMPLVMRLTTSIYGYQGPDNSFSIFLGSTEKDVEFFVKGPKTEEYVWIDPWTLGQDEDGGNAAIGTRVPLSVTESNNVVEIYGDASKLDFIDLHGCYITSVEFSDALQNLTVLDLSHNELPAIDLTKLINLQSIDLTDNAITDGSKMKIGSNHPNLMILQVGINDDIDPTLEIKNYPHLQYFSARNNYGLTSIDPTQNPELVSLVLEVTNISSIDVSKNPKLRALNLSNTKVTNIDISKNTALTEFYASHAGSYNSDDRYKLSSIDVSHNPELMYLDLGGNNLTEIDLSNNPNLVLLFLQRNYLTSIDLSNKIYLSNVDLSNNYFTFATLPLLNFPSYYYYQRPMKMELKYKVGDTVDLSDKVIRAPYQDGNGNTINPATYAQLMITPRAGDPYAADDDAFTFVDGVLTFNKAFNDPVHVLFHCTAFEDWDLQTEEFMVKTPEEFDLPTTSFSFLPQSFVGGREIGFKLGAVSTHSSVSLPASVTISIDGVQQVLENVVTSAQLPEENNVTFTMPSTVNAVYVSLPDGISATQLAMDGVALASIDVSPAENLKTLAVTNARLNTIDLGYNRELTKLNLSGNNLESLDLKGVRGDYEKWELSEINVSDNMLTSIVMTEYSTVTNLNASKNSFTNFDFKYYTGLRNLDMSNNRLSGEVLFEKQERLENVNLSNNLISMVTYANWNTIKSLNLSGNYLNFATLPILAAGVDYTYAPQNKMQILSTSPSINLSRQNINDATTFVWKYSDTKTPLEETAYTNNGGATKFDESIVGKLVYCEMTNPAFPAFDNAPLTTTDTKVATVPTEVAATFVTPTSTRAQIGFRFADPFRDNAVYIDWRGDGSEYEPFIYEANYSGDIYMAANTVAGATAKVYTYDDPANIVTFAAMELPMSKLDASPMTGLRALDVHKAGLTDGNIKLAPNAPLQEIVLDGNNFVTESFAQYPVVNLNLANNKYVEFDLSKYSRLVYATLADNRTNTSVKFGNNRSLMQIDLTSNSISSIDLNGLPSLQALLMSDNKLTEIDVTPVKNTLSTLYIAGNYFTFETLPHPSDMNPDVFIAYSYAFQNPINVECVDGRVDLSKQADVKGTPTTFQWFLGDRQNDVYYDYYYEDFIGERLEGPEDSDDPEYSVENGVTTFHYNQNRKVICAMTNEEHPNLILYSTPTTITKTGVDEIVNNEDVFGKIVDVYNLNGVLVRSQMPVNEALQSLQPGIYIVGGKKVLVK